MPYFHVLAPMYVQTSLQRLDQNTPVITPRVSFHCSLCMLDRGNHLDGVLNHLKPACSKQLLVRTFSL